MKYSVIFIKHFRKIDCLMGLGDANLNCENLILLKDTKQNVNKSFLDYLDSLAPAA